MIKRNLIELNQEEEFDILSFNMEMPQKDNSIRDISSLIEKTTEELYSLDNPISEEDFLKVDEALNKIKSYPVYIIDLVGTVDDIYQTIKDFVKTRKLSIRKRKLIITLDHTLLTKGRLGENEKQVVDELMKMFVSLRKELPSEGVDVIIFILSQLNRDIESKERVLNSALHYPTKNDIFAASSVYYSSDYVLVSHKPATISGITQYYGPSIGTRFPKGLPVFDPDDPDTAMVYWHLIKNRFGKTGIIPMIDRFKFAKLEEKNFSIDKP